MREQEMRMRVFQFLKARMRNMLMPATVGIGLAVGGCTSSGALDSPTPDASDTRVVPIYGIFSDAWPPYQADAAPDNPDTTAPPDASPVVEGRDGAPDEPAVVVAAVVDTSADRIWVKYGAPDAYSGPDTGIDAARPDSAVDVSAGGETALPIRYAAVMPPDAGDAPLAYPLYMAPPPKES